MIRILVILVAILTILDAKPKQFLEDTLILYAFDATVRNEPYKASSYFYEAFKQTNKKEYLYQSLQILEPQINPAEFIKQSNEAMKLYSSDDVVYRFHIIALLKQNNLAEASKKAQILSDKSKKEADYLLLADIKTKEQDVDGIVRALENGYNTNYNPEILERLVMLKYLHKNEKQDSIELLKSHIKVHGNSKSLGYRLGLMLADSKELDKSAQMFLQTYREFDDLSSANELIKIYVVNKDYSSLIKLLESDGLNDNLLLDLYIKLKDYNKASLLAKKLYESDSNPLFLAQSAIFLYEGAENKNDKAIIDSVLMSLIKANEMIDEPLYQNYLGYLMIDHDVDIKNGMEYVKKALLKEPKSPYYIDSLAWGHYKLGECDEALRLILEVKDMIGDSEQEVNDHLKAINKCKRKN